MKKLLLVFITHFVAICLYAQTPSYYNDVDLSLNGQDLKNELGAKVTTTQRAVLSYTPGVWEALQQANINPQNPNEVLLIYGYSDTDGILKSDRTRGVSDNGGAASQWNREHVYPRSLGNPNLGSTGPGSDAHHLHPADPAMNSMRSNRKFAAGSGNAAITAQGYFYPGDEWKGDVARMMLFMYIRYDNRCLPATVGIGNPVAGDANMIDLFLNWNVEDPVNSFEDTRNDAIEDIQGNRNPFIDNPALATQIWGGPQAEDRFGLSTGSENTIAQELFFTEYVEGSSFNKVLEIANYTGSSVALSGYSLRRQGNGAGGWSSGYNLSGSLATGEVYVVANNQSSNAASLQADAITNNTALSFNGNDPVGLFKNGVLVDIIGTFNGGSANFAKDVTLRRTSTVAGPSTIYNPSEWDRFSSNSFGDLGVHTLSSGSSTPNRDVAAPSTASRLMASSVTASSATISWNPSTDNVGVTAYEIFKNNTLVATSQNTSYEASNLIDGTSYTFTVRAKDAAGNISSQSTAVTFTTLDVALVYCEARGNDASYEYIDYVAIGGIANTTASNGGYVDLTNQIGNLNYGSNTVVLSVGFLGQPYTETLGVWIDYNRNGTFENIEKVVAGSTSSSSNLSYTFTVPTTALQGKTRMRVAIKWNGIPTACETFAYGEVEDYTVQITAGRASLLPRETTVINKNLTEEARVFDVTVGQRDQTVIVRLADNRPVHYTLYNMLGQSLGTGDFTTETTIDSLKSGMYILQIFDGQRSLQKKFVKR